MPQRQTIEILYHDDDLLVVNKPAGLLSVPGRDPQDISVSEVLRTSFPDLIPVHRLDRDTSGALLLALSSESHRILSGAFAGREVGKVYFALVTGRPAADAFTVELPLMIDRKFRTIISGAGKPSVTEFRVLERFARYSLLEARPMTGRQHQIRVHLASAGHSLIVDPLYGSSDPMTITHIKPRARVSADTPQRPLLSRTPLHSGMLRFPHPSGSGEISIEAPLPKDMLAVLKQLRKWSR